MGLRTNTVIRLFFKKQPDHRDRDTVTGPGPAAGKNNMIGWYCRRRGSNKQQAILEMPDPVPAWKILIAAMYIYRDPNNKK